MLVHPSDNNTEFQIWRRGRTHEERALREILGALGPGPFKAYDVGANAGSFSVRLGAMAPSGSEIHAFEPNPEMRARLVKNLDLNGIGTVTVHDCAISDQPGQVELFLPDVDNLGQARLNAPFKTGEKITVQAHKLTEFFPKDPKARVDFLKVDIEGAEDRAICPILSDLSDHQWPRMVFFEHKHNSLWQRDVVADLKEAGYAMKKEFGRNALFERPW